MIALGLAYYLLSLIDPTKWYLYLSSGYTISLIALLGAVFIFLSFRYIFILSDKIHLYTILLFREMRCLRHKIHIGLFFTLILSDMSWIFTALIQVRLVMSYQIFNVCDMFQHITFFNLFLKTKFSFVFRVWFKQTIMNPSFKFGVAARLLWDTSILQPFSGCF